MCMALELLEGGHDILRSSDFDRTDFDAARAGCCFKLAYLQRHGGIATDDHDCEPAEPRHKLLQEFESLANKIG